MHRRGTKWDCVLARESAALRPFIFFLSLARSLAPSFSCVRCARVFRILRLCRARFLSVSSDTNCLLPNLIRNFRRRGNLTSFLFSLARSYARSYTFVRALCFSLGGPLVGSRSQDFSIRGPAEPTNQFISLTRGVRAASLPPLRASTLFTGSSPCPARSKLFRKER